jgi:hypothetical protein
MPGASQTPHENPGNEPQSRPPASLPASGPVPLDVLVVYASEVLSRMAENRDVKSDDKGRALYRLRSAGVTPECTWQLIEADFSAIGMATDMPLIPHAYADAAEIDWHFGPTLIAATPRSATPKEVADRLDMNVLLDAFRRFVAAESVLFPASLANDAGRGSGPVVVDPEDCTCTECGGSLEITDVDDATMSVACEAGHAYELEHDAFEAAFDYVLEYLSRRGSDE